MKTLKDVDIKSKRVLVRVDFNEPLDENGSVKDDFRIKATLPTLQYLIEKKCKLILMTHVGRPNGKIIEKFRTDGAARKLEKLIFEKVEKLDDCVGDKVKSRIENSSSKIILLENLRFYKGEESNDEDFAKKLSELGEFYVNDAFANCHRSHASMVKVPKFLPSAAGLLVEKEVVRLSEVRDNPKRPFTFILGGAKLETKMPLLKSFVQKADNVLVGGKIANTLLKASGVNVGASKVEGKFLSEVATLVPKIADANLKIPVDVAVSKQKELEDTKLGEKPLDARICDVKDIKDNEIIYDVGPRTLRIFGTIISNSKMILWNGPMGYFEKMGFGEGTKGLVDALAKCDAETIVGGGETVDFLGDVGARDKMNFISTGGGAMLNFLKDGKLVALELL
ncbi:MAG: hypothetical protein ACD_63C00023G0010 [uncultured bacterium]|nr:MAG: hypothetical protein ACD_63C00023G0010 [uncultured bacterium]